jgi:hypothetical protein
MPKRLGMLRFVRLMMLLIIFVTVVACVTFPFPPRLSPELTPTLPPSPSFTSPLPTPTSVPPTPQAEAEVTPIPATMPPPAPTPMTPTATPPEGVQWGVEIQGPSPGLRPSYLPEALRLSEGMMDTEQGTRLFFGDPAGQWLIIDQSQAPADRSLPEGERVQVNGQEAVLLTGQSGVVEWLPMRRRSGGQQERPEPQELRYENATRLIWYAGDTRIEMLSNLDVQEVLKVAESMR